MKELTLTTYPTAQNPLNELLKDRPCGTMYITTKDDEKEPRLNDKLPSKIQKRLRTRKTKYIP